VDTALTIKHHSLTGRIDFPLMYAAFRAVKRNKGKAGVDRVSIELFAQQLDQNLIALRRDLQQGTFQPLPVLRKYLKKPDGVLVDFQNGINDERVAALAGRERCLGCVITIGAGMYEPGVAMRTDSGRKTASPREPAS